MSTKITITAEELSAIVAKAVADALAADRATRKTESAPKVKAPALVVTDELKAKVLEAVKLDTVKDEKGYYKSYTGRFIIGGAVKKYGTDAAIKDNTWLAAAKDYAIIK